MSDGLGTYKKILLLTNSHLEGYQPGGVTNVSGGKKFSVIIDPHFARPKVRGTKQCYAVHGKILRCPPEHSITFLRKSKLSRP